MDNFTLTLAKSFFCLTAALLFAFNPVAAQLSGSSKIDHILSSSVAKTGVSDLMVIKDGAVVYNRSFGASRQTAVRKVNVATASKWLVSATLLALVDDGVLNLDDPVSKFLPLFKNEKAEITLRQLLSHASGLPSYSGYLKDKNLSLAKSVDSIAIRTALVAEPGTQFHYGSVSFQVAARLAEVATGKDWESLFREKIASPCKMINTDFGKQQHKNIGESAYSTVDDYANFLVMILNRGIFQGVRVLSANAVHEMTSDQTERLPISYTPYRSSAAKQAGYYGLGVWIDRALPGDNTATEASCQGSKGFTPWINYCKHLAGVYSFDHELNLILPVIEETKKIIDEAFKDNCNDILTSQHKKDDVAAASPQSLNIVFKLEADAYVSLKLFDPLGNEALVLISGKMKAGDHSIPVDAAKLNAGVYFYRLEAEGRTETKKITVRK